MNARGNLRSPDGSRTLDRMFAPSVRRDEALRLLAWGDVQGAFSLLRRLLEYPASLSENAFPELLDILMQVWRKRREFVLASAVEAAVRRPRDAMALLEAALVVRRHGHRGLAAGLLARADRMMPGEPRIVTELALALADTRNHREAAACLLASGLAESVPLCRALLAMSTFMSGDVEATRTWSHVLVDSDDVDVAAAGGRLADMLARFDALIGSETASQAGDVAAWHAVLNGALLLHVPAEGYDAGMGGRYNLLFDEPALIREGIVRFAAVLDEAGIDVPRIFALPDRSSRVVAMAMGHLWDRPVATWPEAGTDEPGIVVGYDLRRVDEAVLSTLGRHRAGQALFTHATCWTTPPPIAPDATTLLHQRIVAPWDAACSIFDPVLGRALPVPEGGVDLAPFVAAIVEAPPLPAASSRHGVDALRETVRAARSLPVARTLGVLRSEGPRLEERAGSPVASVHFYA